MIELKNVTKKYSNNVAVKNVSFSIEKGEIVGLLGPNGAGKSTIMNMITGYIEQTEGDIYINKINILKKPQEAKKNIGYMPEGVPLYSDLTTKEFITYMEELKQVDKKIRKEEINNVLKKTLLEEVKNKLIKNLSRGYKQRVSLAGALVGNPEILILDEPTVGLDPKQIIEIRKLIKELGKTHTIILSSHILSEVSQICNKVIIINEGKIVTIDTPENLEKKSSGNSISIIVEDVNNKIIMMKDKIDGIIAIKFIEELKDKTKKYRIDVEKKLDLRKKIFVEFAKQDITIFEMKKIEKGLEDAFIEIIKEGGKKSDSHN